MHEFPEKPAIQNIYSNAFLTVSKYHRLPIWIRARILGSKVMFLPLYYMGNSNYLKLMVPNMHKFCQFWMFYNLHDTLDKIIQEKYNLPMQRKSLYISLFANFDHQSMHQVLQGLIMFHLSIWGSMRNNIKSRSTASVQLSAYAHWSQTHRQTPEDW